MQHLEDGILHALVDGEVPSEELLALTAHLDACADCRVRLAEARALADDTGDLIDSIDVPEGVRAVLPVPRRAPLVRARDLAWAATVVLAVGLGYVARAERGTPPPASIAGPEMARPAVAERDQSDRVQGDTTQSPVTGLEEPSTLDQVVAKTTAPARSEEALQDRPAEQRALPIPEPVATRRSLDVSPAAPQTAIVRPAPAQFRQRRDSGGRVMNEALGRAAPAPVRESVALRPQVPDNAARIDEVIVTTVGGARRRSVYPELEGLVPDRVVEVDSVFLAFYTVGRWPVVLMERPAGDSSQMTLLTPPDMPADSVRALERRIRPGKP